VLDRTNREGEEVFSAVSDDEMAEGGEDEISESQYMAKLKELTPEEIKELKEQGLLPDDEEAEEEQEAEQDEGEVNPEAEDKPAPEEEVEGAEPEKRQKVEE
jgi:hypothetical protein